MPDLQRLVFRPILFFALVFGLALSTQATTITISSTTIENVQGGAGTYELRVWLDRTIVDSDGITRQGGAVDSPEVFRRVTCSLGGTTVTIPSFTLTSTKDARVGAGAKYTAKLYRNSTPLFVFGGKSFWLMASLGTTVTWSQIWVDNTAAPNSVLDTAYYTAPQTDAQIADAVAVGDPATTTSLGAVKISKTPADPALPVAVGSNDLGTILGPGIVQFATSGESSSSKAVRADDVRLATSYPAHTVTARSLVTGGAGTDADPYTGWHEAIIAAGWQSRTSYYFGPGVYYTATNINILNQEDVHLLGAGWRVTRIKFGGSGVAVTFNNVAAAGGQRSGVEDIEIDGNASATRGLYLVAQHHGTWRNVNVRNVTQACFWVEFAVLNVYDKIRCSRSNDVASGFTVTPSIGFYGAQRGGGETVQANTFIDPIFEILSGNGMEVHQFNQNVVIGGSSEGNGGAGMVIGATSHGNTFIGTDNESNTGGADFEIYGSQNSLVNCLATGTARFRSGAHSNVVRGGRLNSIQVDSGAKDTAFYDVGINLLGTGGITVGDESTLFYGPVFNVTANAAANGNRLPATGPLSVGLPYTESAGNWDSLGQAVFNVGVTGSIHSDKLLTAPTLQGTVNGYFDGANWRYRQTGLRASNWYLSDGEMYYRTAAAGTAGNVITWTTTAKMGNDGKLYVNDGGSLKAVTYGANDSGGAGFKVLKIAN